MDEKVMTQDELKKLVAETVTANMSAEQIEKAVAPIMEKYLSSNGVKAQIVGVFNEQAEAAQRKKVGGELFFSRLVNDKLAIMAGEKPRHGTDFNLLAEERDKYIALTGATTTQVGDFVPPEQATDFIDLVFRDTNKVVGRCRRRPMNTDSMVLPTLAGGVTAYWVKEALDTSSMASQATGLKPESSPTTGSVTLNRYCVAARVLVTRKMLRTSLPAVEDAIRVDAPRALEAAIQKAIFLGSATAATDPVSGLDTLISTNAKTWNAGNPRRGIMDFLYASGISYGEVGQANLVVMGPHAAIVLASLEDKTGRELGLLTMPNGVLGSKALLGVEAMEAFCIPATYGGGSDSRIYAGNFGLNANIGIEPAMFVQVNPYRYSAENVVELLFETYFGFVPSNEAMFAYMNVPTA